MKLLNRIVKNIITVVAVAEMIMIADVHTAGVAMLVIIVLPMTESHAYMINN